MSMPSRDYSELILPEVPIVNRSNLSVKPYTIYDYLENDLELSHQKSESIDNLQYIDVGIDYTDLENKHNTVVEKQQQKDEILEKEAGNYETNLNEKNCYQGGSQLLNFSMNSNQQFLEFQKLSKQDSFNIQSQGNNLESLSSTIFKIIVKHKSLKTSKFNKIIKDKFGIQRHKKIKRRIYDVLNVFKGIKLINIANKRIIYEEDVMKNIGNI